MGFGMRILNFVLLLIQVAVAYSAVCLLLAYADFFDLDFEDLKINFFCRINKLSSLLEDQNLEFFVLFFFQVAD
jgi:hypothetical protein